MIFKHIRIYKELALVCLKSDALVQINQARWLGHLDFHF